ncbi:hypothetical protein GCM10009665_80370 [Kitasatospora nipponensis]|uniref:Uncharacterized protein n=1 Tax=Kitasatospora nipponensis TaxID=258049 RepID=A0ABP4E0C2_9ACTN
MLRESVQQPFDGAGVQERQVRHAIGRPSTGRSVRPATQGEAECFAMPGYRTAVIYSSLDKWGLHG